MQHRDRVAHQPVATVALLVCQLAFFFALRMGKFSKEVIVWFSLGNDSLHPAGMVLHPLGMRAIPGLICILVVVGMLGVVLEKRIGSVKLLAYFVAGNVLSGAFFFWFASISPEHCGLSLTAPAGGLVSWWMMARRELSGRVSIFGESFDIDRVINIAGIGILTVVFGYFGPGATGWILAALVGGFGVTVLRRLSIRGGTSV